MPWTCPGRPVHWARLPEFGFVSGKSTHSDRIRTIRYAHGRYNVMLDTHTADGRNGTHRRQRRGLRRRRGGGLLGGPVGRQHLGGPGHRRDGRPGVHRRGGARWQCIERVRDRQGGCRKHQRGQRPTHGSPDQPADWPTHKPIATLGAQTTSKDLPCDPCPCSPVSSPSRHAAPHRGCSSRPARTEFPSPHPLRTLPRPSCRAHQLHGLRPHSPLPLSPRADPSRPTQPLIPIRR